LKGVRQIDNLQLPQEQIDNIIDLALAEDISHGDVTTEALIPSDLQGKASILVKARGILAGNEVAKRVFLKVSPLLEVEVLIQDGAKGSTQFFTEAQWYRLTDSQICS
jgi:nicotinate-nucleotide pyrophosphorylase (carboxylating)